MRVLLVHPSPLLFSEIYLRLEPLGLERVAAAVEAAGHEVRLLDLQVFRPPRYRELLASWRPEAIGFSLNYLANVPEVVELARTAKAMLPGCRVLSPEAAAEDLASVRAPNVFIVDDVAFIRGEDGFAIADQVERRNVRKRYYLETRADVLLRNREVFERWAKLGLRYMFLGIEAIDEEGLRRHRKRVHLGENERALEVARELGLVVAINIIADPDWDERRFEIVRQWAMEVPEIVNLTINTPYPGTETWLTESRRLTSEDYRPLDVPHPGLPSPLPP